MSLTPVTVLTGFLGSGKTTLLNRLLADPRFRATAAIVNEWGEVPVDHALVRSASENVVVLPSGCVCCRVAGDLVDALRELHFGRASGAVPAFERAVIETTGLADPAPLLATLVELPLVAARYSLAGVVTVVDAEHGPNALDRHVEAVRQAAMADRVVISKCDRAGRAAIEILEARIATLCPGADILRSGPAAPDPALLLETGLYRGRTGLADAEGWLRAGAYRRVGSAHERHDPSIDSFAWFGSGPMAWDEFEDRLVTLLDLLGERILRMKGLVHAAGEPGPRAVHAVHHTLYPSARLPAWPSGERNTRLVFIGRGLEEGAVARILS